MWAFHTFILVSVLALLYFAIRNHMVFKYRSNMIDDDFDLYKTLPEYETMLWKQFWVWPLSRFEGSKNETA